MIRVELVSRIGEMLIRRCERRVDCIDLDRTLADQCHDFRRRLDDRGECAVDLVCRDHIVFLLVRVHATMKMLSNQRA